jgi:branched-subunit amino acid aminotransferase/4-amino-4-deoxychorismate lyase
MADKKYICLNGDFLKANEPCFVSDTRAIRYGDSLTENIHAYATDPQFLHLHLARLTENMRAFSMEVPAYFTVDNLRGLIVRLLNKSRIFSGALIRLTVFRNQNHPMIPVRQDISFFIENEALQHDRYVLNEKGLNAEICHTYKKTAGNLSHIHKANAILFLLAGIQHKSNNATAVILLNQLDRMVETLNSNIFLVSGSSFFTPGVDQGCIPGIMRRVIIDLAGNEGFSINDQSNLTPGALYDAEEVFITNAIQGIQWIGAYGQTRYFNKTAKLLTVKLNETAFAK